MSAGLAGWLRAAFGWDSEVTLTAGPRGARGQVWRLDVGAARYALKELFGPPPPAGLIDAELAFARRARAAGVRLPASHADRAGRYLVPAPDGGWLRLYDWVALRPLAPAGTGVPAALGALLARLHRCAPAAGAEPGGDAPDPWYDTPPDPDRWATVTASGAAWSARLADRVATLPALCAAVAPAAPADLVLCHRDLHPENIQADADRAAVRSGPDGARAGAGLVVLDWDNLGPAAPARELARLLFDWFCDRTAVDRASVRATYAAYVDAGGPARLTGPADFTMLLASRLHFLLAQARAAIDPATAPPHRAWAEREIAEALDILPTPGQLADVLALTRAR